MHAGWHWATRGRIGLIAVALAATACSSSATDEVVSEAAPTSTDAATTTVADDEGEPVDALFALLDSEADQRVEPDAQFMATMMQTQNEFAANEQRCPVDLEIRRATNDALPNGLGSAAADEALDAYKSARAEWLAQYVATCDMVITALIGEEPSNEYFQEYLKVRDTMFALEDVQMAACFDLQAALASHGLLNCDANSDVQPSIDLGALADAQTSDVPLTDGPSGGPIAGFGQLPPGPAEVAWFPRPFAIDHPDPLLTVSGDDYVWFTRIDDTFSFEMFAFDDLVDPADLRAYEVRSTIEVPDDLTAWFEALPVTIIDSDDVTVGGSPATRWVFTPDRDAMIAATGDESATFAAAGTDSFATMGAFAGMTETHTLWHVRTPSGPLFIRLLEADPPPLTDEEIAEIMASMSDEEAAEFEAMLNEEPPDDFGNPLQFTESVLASLTFR